MAQPDPADAFFAGDTPPPRAGLQPRRVLLTAAVVLGCLWLLWPLRDEIAFHFAPSEPVALGDATTATALPMGAYVEVTGVLGNKAATLGGFRPGSLRRGPIQVRQLLGSKIFVEFDQDARGGDLTLFTEATLTGRLLPFREDMAPVRDYFRDRLAVDVPADAALLVVDEAPGAMHRYLVLLCLCLAAIAASVVLLVRSARTPVLDDDEA